MAEPNFEVIPGGKSEENNESEMDRQRRMGKENRMTEQRMVNDAELIKGGARMGGGKLQVSDEQIVDMQGRLKRVESVIQHLESPEVKKGLDELRERGKALARDMRILHTNAQSQKVARRVITDAAMTGSSVEPYQNFKGYEDESKEPRKRLQGFFSEVRAFAERYGLDRLGGVDLNGGRERYDSVLAADIAEHFETPDRLIDAIEQVRDAKLYRAYAEKKEVTGSM